MSRAEERANEAYPPTFSSGKLHAKRIQAENVDTHAPIRTIYLKGYKQAEKDLALTWHDIDLIVRIHDDVMEEAGGTPKDFAEETLRRFLEQKQKK